MGAFSVSLFQMSELFKQGRLLTGAVIVALMLSGLPATAQATEDKPPYDWTVRELLEKAEKLESDLQRFT